MHRGRQSASLVRRTAYGSPASLPTSKLASRHALNAFNTTWIGKCYSYLLNVPANPNRRQLFLLGGKWWLVTVGYYPCFLKIVPLKDLSSSNAINNCESISAKQDIHAVVVSNSEPVFRRTGLRIQEVPQAYKFIHATSSPSIHKVTALPKRPSKLSRTHWRKLWTHTRPCSSTDPLPCRMASAGPNSW